MENPYRDSICNILNTHLQHNITAKFLSNINTENARLGLSVFLNGKEGKIVNVL